ncbi:MAG: glycosyltransferase family 39 protein [Planctomycetota bacterium]|nr:glycosyltransferase family 39 protein [Planctomycetota bacterium]
MTSNPPANLTKAGWLAPLALAALMGGLLFVGLGNSQPLRTHEALLAETARNMHLDRPVQLADGSRPSPWLVPNFNDSPRLRKTPLPYWTVAGLAYLTGAVDEWTARLPSALAALATALIVLALVRRWDGRLAGLAAAAALVTSAEFLIVARSALADMPLTLFCTASLAAAWMAVETGGARRLAWLLATGVAAGLAMLAKGPVPAVVLPLPFAVAAVVMISRLVRPKEPQKARGAAWAWTLGGAAAGTLLFLAILLPWPAYVMLHVPQAADIWRAESVDRSTGDYGHQEPFYFYFIRLPLLLAPWTIFFIHGLVLAARRARREPAARAWLIFVGAWFVGTLGAISVAAGKQDHYLLPLVPACAVYIAMSLRHWLEPATPEIERAGRWLIGGHAAALLVIAVAGGIAYALMRGGWIGGGPLAKMQDSLGYGLLLMALPAAAGSALALAYARLGRVRLSLAILIGTFAAMFLAASCTLIGMTDRATVAADFGRQVRREVPADAPLFSLADSNHTVIYYAGRPIPILPAASSVQEELARGRPFYLICHDKQVPALKDVAGLASVARQEDRLRPDEGFQLLRGDPPAK